MLYYAVYGFNAGLLFAVPLFNNSWVIHSIDKTTSTYIHLAPTLNIVTLLSSDCTACYPLIPKPDFTTYFLSLIGFYSIWAIFYYAVLFHMVKERL
mmetsp:Transcript_12498/g.1871  ORF Transcript_12498/g.1871 Transcript_12498/m.1871 type:complete len:96 (+) Transcript_12498:576-863(+)